MKVKRLKRANRLLTFYKYNFKFLPPYRVLVDGTFCNAALQEKLNLAEQIPKYLTEETHLMTTNCVLKELEKFGPLLYGALVIAKQFEIAECNHHTPKAASDCLAHLARRAASGKTKYLIATQDDELTEKLRTIVGTPIMYIKFKTVLLDNVSEATKAGSTKDENEIKKLKELKKEIIGVEEVIKKKKKKKGGANPLSCKKKLMKATVEAVRTGERTATGKRKRTKKKATTVE
uniref:rRNA-processing protein UTP23 homolog n=1 Tax=Caenorhabditis tropicalis TaxID=1561998 RepID=A0A1I7TWP9_9PELO